MIILGLADWIGGHDSSAAIVCDGRLVATAEEERFTRVKHDGGLPVHAAEFCLRQAGIDMSDVDLIAFAGKPFRSGADSSLTDLDRPLVRRLIDEGLLRRRTMVHKRVVDAYVAAGAPKRVNLGMNPEIRSGLRRLRDRHGRLPPVRYFGHHMCHAAAAYYTSGLDRAAIVTADGRGGWHSTVAWRAEGNDISPLRAEPYSNSLGFFYSHCTEYLGLGQFGEGKAMGLASYGDPERFKSEIERILRVEGTGWYQYAQPPSPESVGFAPRTDEPVMEHPYPDFAAAFQSQLQRAMVRVVEFTCQAADSRDLCLGGGVSLNCSSNGALLASGAGSSVSLFPATGDGGLATGAALLCAAQSGRLEREPLQTAYWGPEFGEAECTAALRDKHELVARRPANLAREVAALLASGKIAGWFQGRMEVGPRALGNRSILADPRSTSIRDRVNRCKQRESWRPLAPAVLAERAGEYFHLNSPSPFMLLACQVRNAMRALIPGVVHVDGSARPQTVSSAQNARYYDLIRAFEEITQIPVLMNTSFNDADEPVVCSPADAIRTFLNGDLDVLVLGDFIVSKRRDDESPHPL